MSEFASMFTFMKSGAKAPGGGMFPRLPVGTHEVALRRYYLSQIKTGFAVIAELMVLQSNNPAAVRVGEVREWAWFPGNDPYGTEKGRAMQCPETFGKCIGDNRPSDVIGDSMADGHYNGVRVHVTIREELMRDGVTVKRSKAGNVIYNITWSPVAQTLESITATRARMVELEATLPAQVPAQNSFATPAAAPQQTAPNQFAQQPQPAAAPAPQAPNPFGQGAPNPFGGFPQQAPAQQAPNPFGAQAPNPFPFQQPQQSAPPTQPVAAPAPNPLAALFGQVNK